ncbi:MAG: DEAD/DEAH box helicase [Desulfamplus sp.]|nr:DEAD/DEAH box helicase [Desulfamplus sp.]
MNFRVFDKIYMDGLQPGAIIEIERALTLPNKAKEQLVKMGKWAGNMPDSLTYSESFVIQGETILAVPRGAGLRAFKIVSRYHGKDYTLTDERTELPPVQFEFKGTLKSFQEDAITELIKNSSGILVFPTGGGKTVAMLSLIARRGQPTLVIVDKKELLYQWQDRACQFLDISPDAIGIIGAGKFSIGDRLTIGTIQTISKHMDELKDKFGQVIVDECHKAAASIFSKTITKFTAKYIHGCTATPIRNDGQTEALKFYFGEVVYQINKQVLLNNGDLCQARFKQIPTSFDSCLDGSTAYTQLLTELVNDSKRNSLICQTIADHKTDGLSLILSGRVDHCNVLQQLLKKNHGIDAHVITGSLSAKKRDEVFNRIKSGTARYIIATTALLKEGFDLPVLQSLFLTYPVKWRGSVIQMIGRILRPVKGKQYAMVIDFNDINVGVLKNSARVRAGVYKAEKIREV